jgi:uncharacterized membrane protein HdeD (DUF308 family)
MTTYDVTGHSTAPYVPPTWLRVLLGIVLIAGGLFVLGDIALATLVSTLLIGSIAVVVGAFEIAHAFWTKGWGGFAWQLLLGVLYIVFGLMVIRQPLAGALVLTFVIGLVFAVSGIVRVYLGFKQRHALGWVMVLSGIIGIIAGLIVLAGWPMSGIWVLGLLLGIDLISHGIAWLVFGTMPATRMA